MASSFFALFDDIATILHDVAAMTKVAATKTAGVLGDDLALNAQQTHGVKAERELLVVWAVAKGSFKNKLILVPSALIISCFANWAIIPLLMVGGAYLCFEGFEKLAQHLLHSAKKDKTQEKELFEVVNSPEVDMVAFEKDKIHGAVRTDFILSAEIIVIALGSVANATFIQQIIVVSGIAVMMTIGVYGVVAGIVKLDDAGLHYMQKTGESFLRQLQRYVGMKLLATTPYLMRALSIIGTVAMFMVGGGILAHGIDFLSHNIEYVTEVTQKLPVVGSMLAKFLPMLINVLVGILAGAIVLTIVESTKKIKSKC